MLLAVVHELWSARWNHILKLCVYFSRKFFLPTTNIAVSDVYFHARGSWHGIKEVCRALGANAPADGVGASSIPSARHLSTHLTSGACGLLHRKERPTNSPNAGALGRGVPSRDPNSPQHGQGAFGGAVGGMEAAKVMHPHSKVGNAQDGFAMLQCDSILFLLLG